MGLDWGDQPSFSLWRSEDHFHTWSWGIWPLLPRACPHSPSLFPSVSVLKLPDFSALFLKVSFPFNSIIFRTISLISFQDMSFPPFEVSHISDDNELITRRQEESVQSCGGWLELYEAKTSALWNTVSWALPHALPHRRKTKFWAY